MENICNRQAATSVILAMAVCSLVWYIAFLLDPSNAGNPIAYSLLLVAEGIGMMQLLGTWLTIIVGSPAEVPSGVLMAKHALQKHPQVAGNVAVFVPVCGESLDIITETVIAARDIRFPHATYVLDDGASDDVRAIASRLGVEYLRRPDRTGWKAGNINHALEKVPCDFFAILDSDHVARPEFLDETLPWLLSDKKTAFVQTPQYLSNRETFVAGGIAESQEIFYRHIQTAKNRFGAAFCVGTNVVFRTEAVLDVGGMYQQSHSEDIWTSLLLHEHGWKSVYLPVVLASGRAPETVDAFFRQQFRWASGGYEVLIKRNPLLSRRLTLDQRLQYLHTVLFFLSGFSVCIFYLLPLLYVYFGWKPLDLEKGAALWAAHFLPYFFILFSSTAHLMGRWPRWRTYVIALGAFPAHILACIGVLTGIRIRWSASGVIHKNFDYVKSIMVHLLFLFLSLGALPVLMLTEKNTPMIPIMSAWLMWNSVLLFSLCRRAIPPRERKAEQASAPAYAFAPATPLS